MEILSRKVALAANLPKYYTGKLCKNGHLAERYTGPGSCCECVNGVPMIDGRLKNADKIAEALATQTAARQTQLQAAAAMQAERDAEKQRTRDAAAAAARVQAERVAAKLDISQKKFNVPDMRWLEFRDTVIFLTKMRYPSLMTDDIIPAKPLIETIASGVSRYRVSVHLDDYRPLLDFVNVMHTEAYATHKAAQYAARSQFAVTHDQLPKFGGTAIVRQFLAGKHDETITMINERQYSTADYVELYDGRVAFIEPLDKVK